MDRESKCYEDIDNNLLPRWNSKLCVLEMVCCYFGSYLLSCIDDDVSLLLLCAVHLGEYACLCINHQRHMHSKKQQISKQIDPLSSLFLLPVASPSAYEHFPRSARRERDQEREREPSKEMTGEKLMGKWQQQNYKFSHWENSFAHCTGGSQSCSFSCSTCTYQPSTSTSTTFAFALIHSQFNVLISYA